MLSSVDSMQVRMLWVCYLQWVACEVRMLGDALDVLSSVDTL